MKRSERIAHRVFARYGPHLARILQGEGIDLREEERWWKELFVSDEQLKEICLRAGLPRAQKRELIAHALGHYFLHGGNRFYFAAEEPDTLDRQEQEAWEFAAYLLVREEELQKRLPWSVRQLARKFRVTEDFMRLRLALLWERKEP